jgi:hypothetical protein
MKPANPRILTINGGSSSIKFALFEGGDSLQRIFAGGIERIGLPQATLRVQGMNPEDNFSRLLTAPDHAVAVGTLMDWIKERLGRDALAAVGHREVHGGPKYSKPQRITAEMITELHQLSPFDPEHLPEEILLIEAFLRRFPELLKWRVSTRLFTMICRAWRNCCQSRAVMKRRGFGVMDFTACRMNFSWVNWQDYPEPKWRWVGSPLSTDFVDLAREAIKQSPEYTDESLLTRAYETEMHRHYDRLGYWVDEEGAENDSR